MSRKMRVLNIVVVMLLLSGLLGGVVVTAASNSNAVDKSADRYQTFISKLAVNLGIDQAKLEVALKATRQEILAVEVEKGKITQEQADKMAAKPKLDFGRPGAGGKRGAHGLANERAASVLGISQEELKTEMESGQKFDEIVQNHGLTMDQFRDKILAYKKEKIALDLAAGTITQEQADHMLQSLEKRDHNGIDKGRHKVK